MPSRTNALMVTELVAYLGEVEDMVLLGYAGMKAQEVEAFRGQLGESGGRMRVVKNSAMRIALEQVGRGDVGELIEGPVAILHGEDVISIAKQAVELRRRNRSVEIRGAVVGGVALTGAEAGELTKMPSREELLSQIAMQILAPAMNISSAAGSGGAGLAGCLKKRIEDLDKEAA